MENKSTLGAQNTAIRQHTLEVHEGEAPAIDLGQKTRPSSSEIKAKLADELAKIRELERQISENQILLEAKEADLRTIIWDFVPKKKCRHIASSRKEQVCSFLSSTSRNTVT